MDYLYKCLFQVDLDVKPDYNPAHEQLVFFDKMVINLMYYLFEVDIRLNADYVFSEEYLYNVVADTIYITLFNVDVRQVLNFQPTDNPEVPLTNLKNILYQML